MKKVICLLIFLLVLTACSAADNSNVLEGSNEVTVQTNESKEPTLELQESVTEEFSVLITVKTINVRREPSTNSKENIVGKVHMGETYTVFEQNKDKDYMWYRIGDDQWIANDGTWCIEYGNDDKKVCPYVLSDEEKGEFLSSVKTGAHCYSAHSKEVEHYINIFNEPEFEFDYNIYLNNDIMNHSSLNDVYRYNISNVVKVDENTYDAYVVPIEDGGLVDRSTGCLRFSKIGIEPYGDGESLVFYITFIQNQNDAADEKLKQVYDVELRYGPSHVSF